MPSRDFAAFDPLTILNKLRDVEHLVVGGFAAVLYGAPTITGDLDITIIYFFSSVAASGRGAP